MTLAESGSQIHEGSSSKTYPMSYEQIAVWLDDYLAKGPSRFLESWVYRLSGDVCSDAVQWAIATVVDRHEVLRSRLTVQAGRPVQIVLPRHGTRLFQKTCEAADLDEELRRTVRWPLDLNTSPLRATMLLLSPDQAVLAVQLHHAVVDDWALSILDEEFSELYAAHVGRRTPDLVPLAIQYGDYASRQQSEGIDPALISYWQRRLKGVPDRSPVLPDRTPPARPSRRAMQARFYLDNDIAGKVRSFARAHRASPVMVFTAALTALLYRYQGSGDVILGTPFSRRGSAGLDRLIGALSDVLPLRQHVDPHASFTHLVAATKANVLEAMAHKDIPYVKVAAQAERRGVGGTPRPFSMALVVDDSPRRPLDLPGVAAERIYVHSGMLKFDLTLTLVIDGDRYRGFLEYATDLYSDQVAGRIIHDFLSMIRVLATDPEEPLSGMCKFILPWRRLISCAAPRKDEEEKQAMKEGAPRSPWLPYGAGHGGNVRLLLLPHAGAGASVYRQWASGLPATIGVCPVQPPGRERRRAERPLRTVAALASELTPEILASIHPPYAIFGHSMGALCAFELAREIRSLGGPEPVHLFVAGRRAPQLPIVPTRLGGIPVAELALTLKRLGGTPDEVLADHSLLRMLQPLLAADFSVNEDYAYNDEDPLQIPITVFATTSDVGTDAGQAEAWKEQAGAAFKMHVIEGGHFGIFDHRDRVHGLIADSLRPFL